MKLRIKGNSIRLRLGQSEVQRLANSGIVEERTAFGPAKQECFSYALCASSDVSVVSADFADRRLLIRVPTGMIHQWATTGQVGIDALQRTGNYEGLFILIEKDFECIDAPSGESQADAFPNPQLEAACRPAGGIDG
ncbi:MAG: hypothetical protein LV481_17295 [Methylacidiphilales bacterium]|jgi:hypothetical protein|nr:hypothetical protein [Candidatus Methylacidiphilales bacterium]